jgi:hypothetical protein
VRTDYLDCCEQPTLEVVRSLYQEDHDAEALMRCTHCPTPWFYRVHEYATPAGDDLTSWYTRLADEEAERILTTEDPTVLDLDFLKSRQSWMHDDEGSRQVAGQPSHPWS